MFAFRIACVSVMFMVIGLHEIVCFLSTHVRWFAVHCEILMASANKSLPSVKINQKLESLLKSTMPSLLPEAGRIAFHSIFVVTVLGHCDQTWKLGLIMGL